MFSHAEFIGEQCSDISVLCDLESGQVTSDIEINYPTARATSVHILINFHNSILFYTSNDLRLLKNIKVIDNCSNKNLHLVFAINASLLIDSNENNVKYVYLIGNEHC
ncbi:hypothetical protein RF11_01618 [Thelohanellus kitauei]|uniref:Uncharacterized protein n=1 Tax=Thelohanellus kitauei TaxID=669202 RepID=A0A0C2N1E4_THEKT|nr:hypothetical protein RF11_01618 [Thelohanellus kitauei]